MIIFSITGFARILIVLLIVYVILKYVARVMIIYKEMKKQVPQSSERKTTSGTEISNAEKNSGEYIDFEEVKD